MVEVWMSKLQCRGSIALAAVVVALLSSRPADAQVTNDPGPPREPGGFANNMLTGVQYDIVNQRLAEDHIAYLQAKLRRDAERGHSAAAERDARRIDSLRYRVVVDEWLIRKNSLCNPGLYPYPLRLEPVSCAALADVRRPPGAPPTRLPVSRGW
jgi:hypothetical protein